MPATHSELRVPLTLDRFDASDEDARDEEENLSSKHDPRLAGTDSAGPQSHIQVKHDENREFTATDGENSSGKGSCTNRLGSNPNYTSDNASWRDEEPRESIPDYIEGSGDNAIGDNSNRSNTGGGTTSRDDGTEDTRKEGDDVNENESDSPDSKISIGSVVKGAWKSAKRKVEAAVGVQFSLSALLEKTSSKLRGGGTSNASSGSDEHTTSVGTGEEDGRTDDSLSREGDEGEHPNGGGAINSDSDTPRSDRHTGSFSPTNFTPDRSMSSGKEIMAGSPGGCAKRGKRCVKHCAGHCGLKCAGKCVTRRITDCATTCATKCAQHTGLSSSCGCCGKLLAGAGKLATGACANCTNCGTLLTKCANCTSCLSSCLHIGAAAAPASCVNCLSATCGGVCMKSCGPVACCAFLVAKCFQGPAADMLERIKTRRRGNAGADTHSDEGPEAIDADVKDCGKDTHRSDRDGSSNVSNNRMRSGRTLRGTARRKPVLKVGLLTSSDSDSDSGSEDTPSPRNADADNTDGGGSDCSSGTKEPPDLLGEQHRLAHEESSIDLSGLETSALDTSVDSPADGKSSTNGDSPTTRRRNWARGMGGGRNGGIHNGSGSKLSNKDACRRLEFAWGGMMSPGSNYLLGAAIQRRDSEEQNQKLEQQTGVELAGLGGVVEPGEGGDAARVRSPALKTQYGSLRGSKLDSLVDMQAHMV